MNQCQSKYFLREPIYYGPGVRTLVRKFGLKFIIEHQGEGRKTTLWLLMKTFSLGFPYLFIVSLTNCESLMLNTPVQKN